MGFEFSLTTLLKAKKIHEKEVQKELSDTIQAITKLEHQCELLENEYVLSRKEYASLCKERKAGAQEMNLYQNFFLKIDKQIKELKREIKIKMQEEQFIRKKLMEVSKDKKGLEKLESKEYARYVDELKEKESKALDEISIQSYTQRNS